VGIAVAMGALLLALAVTAWGYRRQRRWWVKALLAGLRLLSLLAVLTVVLQPAIRLRNVTQIPNHVAIMVDVSRSMAVREKKDGPTRIERAAALLKRSETRLKEWRERRVVQLYTFGAAVKAHGGGHEGLEASEPATHLWSAVSKVRQILQGKDLAAMIVISDGIDNGRFGTGPLPQAGHRFLEGLEVPVHTAWVGQEEIRDVALAEVFSDDFAFVRNAVRVEAEVVVSNIDADRITVTMETGGSVVAQRELKIHKGKSRYRVRLDFVPQQVGKYVYSVSTPLHAGEALATNNRRSIVMRVIRDRIRVLLVCGRPSWDERFLRRLLKRDPNIDLISFFILRTPSDLSLVPTTELSLIPFPTEELFQKELGSFDLVLLQDFNYKPYGIAPYLSHLRRFVERGGGLAMVGGDLSFSGGEYLGTPLAEVLPVKLLPSSGDPSRLISEEDFRPRLTRPGQDHPILQVGRTRRETQQILAALPLLSGVNLVAGPAPGAAVLAVHPFLKARGKPMPVLATREVGKGRTMALTTDSSWYWAFRSVGAGGGRLAYDRFWRNTVRWLIKDPELKYLRIILQKNEVSLGTAVRAVIRAYNPDYSPAQGLRVGYEVIRQPGGKGIAREATTNDEGEIQLELSPPEEGAYRLEARATIGGRETREDAVLLVEPAGPEEREPQATDSLLRKMSEVTGGRYLGRAETLPDLPFRDPRTVRVNWRRDFELWSRWWSLLACIFFLGLEWLARRRFGYL
jgi:uncharacterized membrane protein